MKNDSNPCYALAGLYRTAVAVSALILSSSFAFAADPPVGRGNVAVNINPTTGYYSTNNTTLRLPNGVSASAATTSAGLPVVTKYPAGLQQTMPSSITIDAIKKSAPMGVSVRATTQTLKSGAKTLFKGNLSGLVLGAGLQQLLDGIGSLIDEGGEVVRVGLPSDPIIDPSICAGHNCSSIGGGVTYDCPPSNGHYCVVVASYGRHYTCRPTLDGKPFVGWHLGTRDICYYSNSLPPKFPALQPVPQTELDDAVDNSYVPEPSDWQNLAPHMMPDDVEITWAPTLQGEPKTTTEYDADGNPHKIRETNIWYDFDIRDNPSPQPKLDVKKREETKTFEDGILTGTTTTESTDSAGSDDTPTPPPESPIDCDLFPTACAWMEWTKEEPTEPDDDLSKLLKEVPVVNETYTITGGAAVCPAPLVLDLSVFGSREVSYQPLCDLASTMKFLYLALMSFAAAVLLNRSINRV